MEPDKNIPGVCNCRKCDRPPVIVRTQRPKRWRVACPHLDCEYVSAYGETEQEAIDNWNKGEVVKA